MIRTIRTAALVALMLALLPVCGYAQEASFESRGARLYYRTIGTGAPVVLLSGGPGIDVDYMEPVAALFQNNTRILFEQRGTGHSRTTTPDPKDFTIAAAVDDLDALRQHLGEPRLFIVGHSWGGMLAMSYAAKYPDRVDRVILIDSGGPTTEFFTWFDDNIRARLRPEDLAAEQYWTEAAKRGVAADKAALEAQRAITPGYFFDRAKGLAFAASLPDGALHADVNEMFARDFAHYDARAGLRALRRPTLIVQCHQDPIGDKTSEDIHALIAGSVLTYLNKCGHFPWLEQPDAFRAAIQEFLASH